ncbi:MAG: hypothetical protein ACK4VN_14015 [Bacteroidales bacterium]
MKKTLLSFVFMFFFCVLVQAQPNGKVGLSGTIQGPQLGISIPIWLAPNAVLAPGLDIRYAETVGTDVSIGLAMRSYIKVETLSPYWGVKLGSVFFNPSSEQNTDLKTRIDLIGGLAFGAEYFISPHFSLGLEAQGNFTKSDENSLRFGNPGGLNFNTATMVMATVYF